MLNSIIIIAHSISTESSSSSSLADTTHWRVTTEPAFITKHKYPNHASTSNHPALSSHHYWSDNSWTTPIDKRPWATNEGDRDVTDDEDRMKKPIVKHPSRPNLDSTFNQVSCSLLSRLTLMLDTGVTP